MFFDLSAIANNRITGIEQIDLNDSGSNTLAFGSFRRILPVLTCSFSPHIAFDNFPDARLLQLGISFVL